MKVSQSYPFKAFILSLIFLKLHPWPVITEITNNSPWPVSFSTDINTNNFITNPNKDWICMGTNTQFYGGVGNISVGCAPVWLAPKREGNVNFKKYPNRLTFQAVDGGGLQIPASNNTDKEFKIYVWEKNDNPRSTLITTNPDANYSIRSGDATIAGGGINGRFNCTIETNGNITITKN